MSSGPDGTKLLPDGLVLKAICYMDENSLNFAVMAVVGQHPRVTDVI